MEADVVVKPTLSRNMDRNGSGLTRRGCLIGLTMPVFFPDAAQADRMQLIDRDIAAPSVDFPLLGGCTASFDDFPSKPVIWPAAGFVDTKFRCFIKPEVAHAEKTVWQ